MKSTTDSNNRELMVEIQDFGLSFDLPYHRNQTVRDAFAQFTQHPIDWLAQKTQKLILFENLNLNIYRGDRVGLLGVNGTGKTSLCRCIAGLYQPSKGRIKTSKNLRAIFNVFVGIQPELTGRENAELLVDFMFPYDEYDRQAILEESLAFSELGEFLNTPYKFYSNGMQARLCLSLISAMPCDVLILDEVFDGADQFFRVKIQERIKKIIEKSGSVIFVSHSIDQISSVCNRVVILNKGQVLFDGAPDKAIEVYSKVHASK